MKNFFIIDGIKHYIPEEAYHLCTAQKAILVDVREEYMGRYKQFDVPEVIYCPLSLLYTVFDDLPRDRLLIFADAAGLHSKEAVHFLSDKGFRKIANLAGGLVEWEQDHMPLKIDKSERLTGSCMCMLRKREKNK
ncbi:MAG: rhodanese-like domain-containing protein [Lentimicrobiaceae bacterium]|nr:rhodanese-like domain-containing protein [Lentimicrobiaceae bacterium]